MTDTPRLLTPYAMVAGNIVGLGIIGMFLPASIHHVLNPGKLDADLGPGSGNPLEDTVSLISYLSNSGNW